MTAKVVGSREARANWRDLLDAAHTGTSDVVIERSGHPVAALIPYRDYEALLEALDKLRATRRAAEAFEAWRQDPSTARAWDEVEVELAAMNPKPAPAAKGFVATYSSGAIGALDKDPRPPGCLRLPGCEGLWCIRVGDGRITYAIDDDARVR